MTRAASATDATATLLGRLAAHHPETWQHSLRVGRLTALLAERAGLAPVFGDGLEAAACLHDIGKLHLPPGLLDKPGALSADERVHFRHHAADGAALFATFHSCATALDDVVYATSPCASAGRT